MIMTASDSFSISSTESTSLTPNFTTWAFHLGIHSVSPLPTYWLSV